MPVSAKSSANAPGTALERLVSLVERALHNDPRYLVERRKRVRDKDTGQAREHDVVITWTDRHHTIITALECRDRSRPVGVPDVEAFHTKCNRTGIHRGLMVSASGFRKTARTKAAEFGIGCMDMTAAEAFDWCAAPGLMGRNLHVRSLSVLIWPEAPDKDIANDAVGWTVFSGETELDASIINANIDAHINWDNLPPSTEQRFRIELSDPDLWAKSSSGVRIALERLTLDVVVELEDVVHPLLFHTYQADGHSYAVAASSFEARGQIISVAMVRDENAEIHVTTSIEPRNK